MGRYYNGDIEGKFWFGIQDSNDASFFGIEPKIIYNRKCGCWYTEDNECGCEIEHVHITEDDVKENKDLIACQPDCDKEFDENTIDEESYNSIEYTFEEIHIDFVKDGLDYCFSEIEPIANNVRDILNIDSENIEKFIRDICINLSKEQYSEICEWLARLELGTKILKCLESKGSCCFECEL